MTGPSEGKHTRAISAPTRPQPQLHLGYQPEPGPVPGSRSSAWDSPQPLAYSVREAAELCGLSVDMVYELCRQQLFPHIRVGSRKIIVPKHGLQAWLDGASASRPEIRVVESSQLEQD